MNKNWWKTFFKPLTAEVMFKPRLGKQTAREVEKVLSEINPREKLNILDLCCGEGRHSLLFAKKHQTVGLDYSKNFLKVAKSKIGKSKSLKANLKFIHGDMKLTSKYFPVNSFDLVVSMYNSFGYFDQRADDFKVLKEVCTVLKPGGHFVINTLNATGVGLHLGDQKPTGIGNEVEKNVFVLDNAYFDKKQKKTFSDWKIIDARTSKAKIFRGQFVQNVYTHKELKLFLKKAGFKIIKSWGALHGTELDEKTSWHQTILARKI
jgi:ubiquinone/menaquinone biosynthesis C-methylase UbiE